MLAGLTVVLGVTGGIAAYKTPELVRQLKKRGAQVFVILTDNGAQFVTPLALETVSGQPVVQDMFARPEKWEVEHIALAKRADLFLIAPATANIMAKMVTGIADDMLSTTVLATRAPILLAPAMNTGMWDNVATQANVKTLADRGVHFVGPDVGELACLDTGAGRMSDLEVIVEAVCDILRPKRDLAGKRVIVTAGPTREALDPVRFLTNRSSGKMGYALAEAAVARGASVTLVTGPVHLPTVKGAEMVHIESTQDLLEALTARAPEADIVIQAAAPADFRPATMETQKIKKQGDAPLELQLVQTPDVAAAIGANKRAGQIFVAFAAETETPLANAHKKLVKKNVDLVVLNDVSQVGAGFDVDTNIITLVTKQGETALPLLTKRQAADQILDAIQQLKT